MAFEPNKQPIANILSKPVTETKQRFTVMLYPSTHEKLKQLALHDKKTISTYLEDLLKSL